jgi:SAM-dependent methyltransferase
VRKVSLQAKVERESQHGAVVLSTDEANWGWRGAAGQIRRERRARFLAGDEGVLPRKPRVLELGCGTGTFSGDLAAAFEDLTCIDISPILIEHAHQRLPGVRFETQDAHRLKFDDASFDLVVGCSVLHHLEWEVALADVLRVLKPGGRIRFSEPNLLNPQIFLQKNWPWLKKRLGDSPDEYAFTPGQIESVLRRLGYQQIGVTAYEFLHPALPRPLIEVVLTLERVLEATPLSRFAGSLRIAASKAPSV